VCPIRFFETDLEKNFELEKNKIAVENKKVQNIFLQSHTPCLDTKPVKNPSMPAGSSGKNYRYRTVNWAFVPGTFILGV